VLRPHREKRPEDHQVERPLQDIAVSCWHSKEVSPLFL
jgi:hypothetical protein